MNIKSQPNFILNPEDFTVSYFFVAANQQLKDYKLLSRPISPNYRSIEQAKVFLDNCKIEGAHIIKAQFHVDDAIQAADLRESLFGDSSQNHQA